jgi:tetratricopeptide (TPR) repeat protein
MENPIRTFRFPRGSRRGALLALLAGVACAGLPAHEHVWIRVRTPHFEITSGLPRADTIALARDLELFRAVVERITNVTRFESRVPTRIYAFPDAASFRPFRRDAGILGYFVATPRANFIALQPSAWSETRVVLQHEYVHFLIRNQGTLGYPPWYDEGLAELLSSVEVKGGVVEFGRIPPARLRALRDLPWLGLGRVLRARDLEGFSRDERASFYSESWALVHYLLYGRRQEEPVADQLTRYLRLSVEDVPHWRAVESAFGVRPEVLERELRSYVDRGRFLRYTIPVERFPTGPAPTVEVLSPGVVASELGRLALVVGEPEHAERVFRAALRAAPELPEAHAGLGTALRFQERWEEAAPQDREALRCGPDDAWTHLDYAEFLLERARRSEDPAERAERLREARHHLARSWKLAPDVPETYAMYGASYLLPGEDPAAGVEALERAHRLLRSEPSTALLLAALYRRLERPDDARSLVMNVRAWSHGGPADARAQQILEGLVAAAAH